MQGGYRHFIRLCESCLSGYLRLSTTLIVLSFAGWPILCGAVGIRSRCLSFATTRSYGHGCIHSQRITTQTASYKLSGNKLTATQRLPESPPVFEPASGDIRINIFWFASLVISLVTASLAILVKQWLREFLAVVNPSPLARVRIRHLREPGIRRL